ncbi:hypothetical protein JOF53_005773 [Crossiella equi]|uniref:Uncharacterized protein n=1 Tax=Crossiella equi TaxID=130796 RepID=A0ABS5AKG2_9PSEU|nr:hypothetical protein [Crossiella equi]MBP2476901.1 hypothetical protein [Crossiella equi]
MRTLRAVVAAVLAGLALFAAAPAAFADEVPGVEEAATEMSQQFDDQMSDALADQVEGSMLPDLDVAFDMGQDGVTHQVPLDNE